MKGYKDMIQKIRDVALEFRKRYGRNLATGFLGELYACEVLGLKLVENPIQKGYDAEDNDGKRYQITTRCSIKGSKVNPRGRIGKFRDLNFDYALLVLLDDKYELRGIWKAKLNDELIRAIREDQGKYSGMHVYKFLNLSSSRRIYPKDDET